MKINLIYIKDFRNIKEIDLQLSDNKIIVISGDTGQGKTNFIKAIIYAFTGYLDHKIENCIRHYQEQFEIKLQFEHLNNIYDLEIIGTKKGASKKLIVNNDTENIYKNSQVDQHLKENVCNPILTLYSSIAMQGESSSILFESTTKRLEKLKQIFGIEKINLACDNIKFDIDKNGIEITKLETELNILKNLKFEKDIIEDLPEFDYTNKVIEFKQMELDKDIWIKEKYDHEFYIKKLDEYNIVQNNIKDIDYELNNLNSQLSEYKIIDVIEIDEKFYKDHVNALNRLQIEKSNYENELKKFKDTIKQIDDYVIQFNAITLKRQIRTQYTKEQLKENKDKLNDLIIKENEIQKQIALAKLGKCPITYEKCISVSNVNIDDLEKLEFEIDKERNFLEGLNIIIENELDEIEYIKQYNEIQTSKKQSIQDIINKLKESIKDDNKEYLEKDIGLIIQDINKLKGDIEQLDKQNTENSLIKLENIKLQKQIDNINNKILVNNTNLKNYKKIIKPENFNFTVTFNEIIYNELKKNIIDYENIKRENERKEKSNKNIIKNEKENSILINEKQNKIDELRFLNTKLQSCKKIIEKEFSAWLIDKGSNYLKEKMNEFFNRAYGKYIVDFKQDGKGIDFYYSEDGKLFSECLEASGFEKEILAIAFRVALNELQNLGIMFLDEIDAFASDSRSIDLYKNLLKEEYNQLFFITHNVSTRDYIMSEYETLSLQFENGGLI